MQDHLKVFAGLMIEDGCPMRCFHVSDCDDIAFVYGQEGVDAVEVSYSRESLTEFVALATEALAKPVA